LALTGAIVGEFIASQHGLGRTIFYAGSTYDIALVWVAVFSLSTLAVIMYMAVSWLENVLRKGTRQ
jgi:NitT/TauT family transport system permease protein